MRFLRLCFAVCVLLAASPAVAQKGTPPVVKTVDKEPAKDESFTDQFIDDDDSWVDISEWLGGQVGLLPVPLLITEPAVGYGGGLALVFFHDTFDPRLREAEGVTRGAPSMTGAFGAATQNGTWFAGGFHRGHWFDDQVRYLGLGFYGDVNINYFGQPGGAFEDGLELNLQTTLLIQEIMFRVADTPLFLGANYLLLGADTSFEISAPNPELTPSARFVESGLGLKAEFDMRDNGFTPNSGVYATGEVQWFSEGLGGDDTFYKGRGRAFTFLHLLGPLVLTLRADWQAATDSTPFFMKPFLELRGIPAMRYQGNHAVVVEMEPRVTVYKRIGVVGIAGAGVTASHISELSEEPIQWALGGGLRYLLAKSYGMHTGIDVARGPETWAFYLVFGNGWRI